MKYVKYTHFVDHNMEYKIDGRRSEINNNRRNLENQHEILK